MTLIYKYNYNNHKMTVCNTNGFQGRLRGWGECIVFIRELLGKRVIVLVAGGVGGLEGVCVCVIPASK